MKKFNVNYLEDIQRKIPGYNLMLDIVFNSILPLKGKDLNVKNIYAIGSQSYEVKNLISLYDKSNIIVVEPSEIMLSIVSEDINSSNLENIELVNAKFEELNIKDKFQLCLCLLVIQFTENPYEFLKTIYGNLDDDGILVLSVFTCEFLDYWYEFALNLGANPDEIEMTYRYQSKKMRVLEVDEVEEMLRDIGFSNVERVCQIMSTALWYIKK